jgi:hypothetical protein
MVMGVGGESIGAGAPKWTVIEVLLKHIKMLYFHDPVKTSRHRHPSA